MKSRLLLFTFLLCAQSFFAQQPSHFFLGKDEFEGVQVYDIIQDNAFNYWFATDHGFYKYDGYSFSPVACNELKGQSAFGFVKNKNGVIFCYNLNNQLLKIENGQCSVFYELKENERSADVYLEITGNNLLLVLTRTMLLFDEAGRQETITRVHDGYYAFPFCTKAEKTISHMVDNDSLLLIEGKKISIIPLNNKSGTLKGALKFFRIQSKTYAVNITDKKYYSFDELTFTLELLPVQLSPADNGFLRFYNENDQLWAAGNISGITMITDPESAASSESLFSDYLVSDVYKDNEGNLLLGTFNNGVIVVPNLQIPDVLPVTKDYSIVSLCHDPELGLLMGTLKGQLILYDGTGYKVLANEGSKPLQSVFSWPGFPYVLFDDGFIKVYNKQTGKIIPLRFGSLKDAALLNKNTLYLSLNSGVCKITLTGPDKFDKDPISGLNIRSDAIATEQRTQHIYVATSDGLKIIDRDGKITAAAYNGNSIFANDIALHGQQVFIASKKNGIFVFENGRNIKNIFNQEGAEIYKIKVIDDKIYANTSQGLVVLDMTGKISTQLNKVYGFSTNKIFDFDLVDGYLWIAHSRGVQKMDLHYLKNAVVKPLIRIAAIHVNDTLIEASSGKDRFGSTERKFLFTLSSPTLRNKENIRYHYRLVGYDTEWQQSAYENNSVIYNALEPGQYTFLVKAENQGVFSETLSYSFFISKPFYFRWWFLLLLGIAFILITLFAYRRQLKKQRKKAEMLNEVNLSRLTAIQSQMNPHFIFNSLNSIQDLVLKADIDNSYTFITKFSDLIRRTLNYSDKDFIDFEEEIKLIELYLSLEKLRFKEELTYSIAANEIEDIMIPPMLIQPFIENSLLHGLLHKEGNKKISISFQLKEILICTIEDNGIGRARSMEIKNRQGSGHESFSGQAIKKRFAILGNQHKGRFGFEYEDLFQNKEPSGTRVTLFIPVKRRF